MSLNTLIPHRCSNDVSGPGHHGPPTAHDPKDHTHSTKQAAEAQAEPCARHVWYPDMLAIAVEDSVFVQKPNVAS